MEEKKIQTIPQIIEEEWKDIPEYEGIYQVSNLGRIKSLSRTLWNGNVLHQHQEIIMHPSYDCNGYLLVGLRKNKRYRYERVHRLVAKAFIPNPYNYRVVNHIDADRSNNNINNLEWCTHKHNSNHAIKIGNRNKEMCKVRVIETGIVYSSIHECARQLSKYKVDYRHVSDCLHGKLKSHAGFHYELVRDEI